MTSQEKIKRRQFLKGLTLTGVVLSGIPLMYLSPAFQNKVTDQDYLENKEFGVIKGLAHAWTEEWPSLAQDHELRFFKNLNDVFSIIRPDKRHELKLALKLLSYPPTCFFLTGYFSPWSQKEATLEVLNRWQQSTKEVERKLYFGFSSIFAAAYYGDSLSWEGVGYPGPPEIERPSS